ncbi:MAG: hypothetical protein DRG50_09605, partial [Deltaproteobacteria bacterium]
MILPPLQYRRARDLKEVWELYELYDGEVLFLAGGTDLLPRLKLRLERPKAVIDLKEIGELQEVSEDEKFLRIGSLINLFDLRGDERVKSLFPALLQSLEATSCETLQMRGTIGGNLLQDTRCLFYNQSEFWRRAKGFCLKMGGQICNATGGKECFSNYCSDNAPALVSLSAEVRFLSPQGERQIPLEKLYTG